MQVGNRMRSSWSYMVLKQLLSIIMKGSFPAMPSYVSDGQQHLMAPHSLPEFPKGLYSIIYSSAKHLLRHCINTGNIRINEALSFPLRRSQSNVNGSLLLELYTGVHFPLPLTMEDCVYLAELKHWRLVRAEHSRAEQSSTKQTCLEQSRPSRAEWHRVI